MNEQQDTLNQFGLRGSSFSRRWPYAGEIARLALVKEETRGHRPRAYDSAITALTRHHNLLILREHIADANLKEGTA
jgi:hypothetical protein